MQKVIHKAERVGEDWHKMTPHLPASGQKWLSENIWWVTAIGAILSAIATITTVGSLIRLLSPVSYYGFELTVGYTNMAVITTLFNILFIGAVAALLFMAVKPLQSLEKKGWVLAFTAVLAGAVGIVINSLISLIALDIATFFTTLLIGAIFIALEAYFLFEIRGKFGKATRTSPKD